MIHWKEFGLGYSERYKQQWRRDRCEYALRDEKECLGYSRSGFDQSDEDEPCDICKAWTSARLTASRAW